MSSTSTVQMRKISLSFINTDSYKLPRDRQIFLMVKQEEYRYGAILILPTWWHKRLGADPSFLNPRICHFLGAPAAVTFVSTPNPCSVHHSGFFSLYTSPALVLTSCHMLNMLCNKIHHVSTHQVSVFA